MITEKQNEDIKKKSTMILLETEALMKHIAQGQRFSFNYYHCPRNGNKMETSENIHNQIVILRGRLLELDKGVRGVNPW